MKFINYACGDITFTSGNGVIKYDPNGVLRLNDFCKFSVTEDYISNDDFKSMFDINKADALEKYGALSDVDLILKSLKLAKVKDIPNRVTLNPTPNYAKSLIPVKSSYEAKASYRQYGETLPTTSIVSTHKTPPEHFHGSGSISNARIVESRT